MKKLVLIQSGSCRTFKAVIALGLTMTCFAPLPRAQAADGGLPNFNTAEGDNALFSLNAGAANTAVGWHSLFTNADNSFNTATGAGSLLFNTADANTAFGAAALLFNTTGGNNTAVGAAALLNNTAGPFNTAVGFEALMNLTGTTNANAAFGDLALQQVTTGFFNTAIGAAAGSNQTTGHNNIYIGQGSPGVAGESNTCYIQEIAGASIPTATAAFVFVDQATGKLGTMLVDVNGNRVTVPISQSQLQAAPQGQPKASHVSEDGRQAMLNLKVKELQATVARQQKQIEALTTGLQKVSAQIEVNKPAPQVVVNKP